MLEGFVGKDPSKADAEPGAGRDPGRRASSFASGKIPPPDPNAPARCRNARQFNPEEINPPVATKGGMTALLHAARQGYIDAARALLDGGADINQVERRRRHQPAADRGDQRPVRHGDAADRARRRIRTSPPKNNGVTPLWAAVNTQWQPRTRFPQPQEMELQKATYLDVMKALLDKGADPNAASRRIPGTSSTRGCGNRNCGLADTAGSTAFWRAAYGTDLRR